MMHSISTVSASILSDSKTAGPALAFTGHAQCNPSQQTDNVSHGSNSGIKGSALGVSGNRFQLFYQGLELALCQDHQPGGVGCRGDVIHYLRIRLPACSGIQRRGGEGLSQSFNEGGIAAVIQL